MKPVNDIKQDIASAYMFRFDREHARRLHGSLLAVTDWLNALQSLTSMPTDAPQKMVQMQQALTAAQATLTQTQAWLTTMQAEVNTMKQGIAPAAAITPVPATALKVDYNVVTTLLGALVGVVNATNIRVNEQTAAINSVLAALKTHKIIQQ